MKVQKFSLSNAELVKSPGQNADIFVGNLVDEKDGGPVTIGYGRYAPGQSLTETMAVHDTMIVLVGRHSPGSLTTVSSILWIGKTRPLSFPWRSRRRWRRAVYP